MLKLKLMSFKDNEYFYVETQIAIIIKDYFIRRAYMSNAIQEATIEMSLPQLVNSMTGGYCTTTEDDEYMKLREHFLISFLKPHLTF